MAKKVDWAPVYKNRDKDLFLFALFDWKDGTFRWAFGGENGLRTGGVYPLTSKRSQSKKFPQEAEWPSGTNVRCGQNKFFEQICTNNCWKECGYKGGLCENACGSGGYCCRRGETDCPFHAAAAGTTSKHTCILHTGCSTLQVANAGYEDGMYKAVDEKKVSWAPYKQVYKHCLLYTSPSPRDS